MDDLISRQAAIDYCYALINAENPSDPSDEWNYSQERINQTEVILHHLEFMPTIDAEPVVRCKECCHYKHYKCFAGECFECDVFEYSTKETDFCSRAERRI